MKKIEQIIRKWSGEAMNSPALIDVKTVHRARLRELMEAAFLAGVSYTMTNYGAVLQRFDDAMVEEVVDEEPQQQATAEENPTEEVMPSVALDT